MDTCKEGHSLLQDSNVCAQGHPAAGATPPEPGAEAPSSPMDPMAMMFQTMQLMQRNMQIMQQAAIQQQNVAHPSAWVKRPDRPGIEVDSTDSDWAMFLDSWQ